MAPYLVSSTCRLIGRRAEWLLAKKKIKAHPPAVGDEPPRPVDLAEEGGCYYALLLVRVEAAVLGGTEKILLRYKFFQFKMSEKSPFAASRVDNPTTYAISKAARLKENSTR